MSFSDHFSAAAREYAARRPSYPPALVAWLATLPARCGTAWDVGCGSGQLSVLLADVFDRVLATDASEAQVLHARPHERVTYRVASAEASGIEAGTVDLSVAAQAAHWFDLPAWYEEVRRVSSEGAAIAIVSYGLAHVTDEVDAVVRRFHDRDLADYWPPERRHVVGGYADLPFPFEEATAPPLAMTAAWTADEFLGYVSTWSGVKGLRERGGGALLSRFAAQVSEAWGDGGRREVRWPLVVRAGRLGGTPARHVQRQTPCTSVAEVQRRRADADRDSGSGTDRRDGGEAPCEGAS